MYNTYYYDSRYTTIQRNKTDSKRNVGALPSLLILLRRQNNNCFYIYISCFDNYR